MKALFKALSEIADFRKNRDFRCLGPMGWPWLGRRVPGPFGTALVGSPRPGPRDPRRRTRVAAPAPPHPRRRASVFNLAYVLGLI